MANDDMEARIVVHLDGSPVPKEAKSVRKELNNALKLEPKTDALKKTQGELAEFRNNITSTLHDIKEFSKVRLTSDELQKQIAFLEGSGTKKDGSKKTLGIIDKLEQKIERLKNAKALATDEKGSGSIEEYAAKIQRAENRLASYNQQLAAYKELKAKADASKTKSVIGYDLSKVPEQMEKLKNETDKAREATAQFRADHQATNATIRENARAEKEFADNAEQAAKASEELHDKGAPKTSVEHEANAANDFAKNLDNASNSADELHEKTTKTDENVKQVAADADNLANSFEKAASASNEVKIDLNADVSQMGQADLDKYINGLKSLMKEIRDAGMPEERKAEFEQANDQLIRAQRAAADYKKNLDKVAEATKALPPIDLNADVAKMNIAELVRYMQQLKDRQKEIENAGMPANRDQEYAQITDQLIRAQRATGEYKKNLDKTAESSQRVSRATISFRNVLSTIKSVGTKAISGIKNGFSSLQKTINNVKSTFNKLSNQMRRGFKHNFTNLVKYVFGFRSLFFLVRRMRKYIGEGLENLARYDDKVSKGVKSHNLFNDAMNKLMTSLNYLKNAWAAAFSPIVIAVVPALTKLIDALAVAGNYVAYFIASLTGQATAYNALKTAVDDYADSLDKSGSSAKKNSDKQDELNEKLAEYDKLLVIRQDKDKTNTTPTGGSGDGNKTAEDFNKMFKTITADDSLAKALKSALDDNDFAEFGKLIGEKIRDGLNSINWEDIKKKIGEVGDKIGKFVKGLFSTEGLAGSIGHAAGEVVNSISTFINSILTQTKDVDFGKGLAKVIEAFIDSTDWNLIKTNIREALGQLRDNIKSAIDNFPWAKTQYELAGLATTISSAITSALSDEEFMSSLGKGIGEALNTVIRVWKGLVTGAKGKDVGKGLAAALNTGMQTIKFDELGQTLGDSIAWVLNNAADFLEEVNWDEFGKAIQKFLSNINWKSVFSSVVRTAITSGQSMIDIFTAIGDGVSEGLMSISGEDLEEAIGKLLEQLKPEKVAENIQKILTSIIKSLFATASIINAIIQGFAGAIENGLTGIGKEIGDKLRAEGKEVTMGNVLSELGMMLISGFFNGMLSLLTGLHDWLINNLVTPFINCITGKDAFDMHSPSKVAEQWGTWIIDGLFNGLSNFWNTLKSIFDPNSNDSIFGKIKGAFSTKNFENIKSALGTAWSTVTGVFKDTWKNIKSKFEVSNPDSVWAKLKGKFDASYFKQNIVPTLSKGWETITGIFTNTWKTIGNTFAVSNPNSIWAKLKGKFDTSYFKQNIVPTLSKGWETVTGVFTGTWENIKSAFEGKGSFIENIKDKFNSVFKIGTYSGVRKAENLSLFEKLFGYTVGSKHIEGIFDKFKSIFTDTFEAIKTGIKTPINKILDFIEGLVNGVINGINAVGNGIASFKIGDKKIFPGTYTPIGGFKFDRKAMGLANGAVIPPNKEFLAVLGDQKQGVNIETPLDTMVDAFKIALADSGSTNHDPIVLQLNSRVVAQAVWDEETKKYKQTGFGLAY